MGLKKLCRTCLCSGKAMYPLFDEIEELKESGFGTAVEILESFTFAPIRNKDYLPDHICATCLNEIQRTYLFTLKCEKSEMILNQLKEVNVTLKRLKEIPNGHEFESGSNCILSVVKNEPEEVLNLYDYDDFTINDHVIKSEVELNKMTPNNQFVKVDHEADNQVAFKNEPELNIEDIKCDDIELKVDEQLKCLACGKQFKTVNMFRGHTVTDHIEGRFCKLCSEETDCSQFEHAVKHIPINYFDEIIYDEPFDAGEDLNKQTGNVQITEKCCQHCSKLFTDSEMLKKHVCPKILGNQPDKDMKMEHTEQKAHKSQVKTKNTIDLTNPKPKHQCSVCSRVFKVKTNLTMHMRIHTGEKPYKCKFCTEQFRLGPRLRVHMETEHLNELPNHKPKFQCTFCLKILASRNHHVAHMRTHTGETPFQCEWCSEKFRYKRTMVIHCETTHSEELANEKPKYQCNVCSEGLRYECDFVAHMHNHDDEKKKLQTAKTHDCNLCSMKFRYPNMLNKHMRNHANAKRQCQVCFEKFRHNRILAIHMETEHINELPEANLRNRCSVCSKLFSNQNSLNVHMRGHTGEKPFQCELCSTSFRHKHLLRVHMEKKHLNDLPGNLKPKYQCNICSKIFCFNHNLVSHMRSHTGERPFECDVCSEKFQYQETLFRHMQVNHYKEMIGNKPNYPCSVCSKTYAYEMALKIHMKSKHENKLPE